MAPSARQGDAVADERTTTWKHEVHKEASGRVCAMPGCGTLLSVYNPTGRCSLHRTFVTIIPRSSSVIAKG